VQLAACREGIEKVDANYEVLIAGGHDLPSTVRRSVGSVCSVQCTLYTVVYSLHVGLMVSS
jgi:hypothetical protein